MMSEQSNGSAAKRVLVLEDETNARTAMVRFLEYCGYAVLPAASAKEALDAATHCPPDVLVCDWKLDGSDPSGAGLLDGVHAAARLQERFGSAVILITAYRLGELRSEARNARVEVAAYYRKPLSLSGLAKAIGSLPKRR